MTEWILNFGETFPTKRFKKSESWEKHCEIEKKGRKTLDLYHAILC